MMEVIYSIIVPAIVSLAVSIWFGRKMIDKTIEIMKKMDADQQETNQAIQEIILSEVRRLRNIR